MAGLVRTSIIPDLIDGLIAAAQDDAELNDELGVLVVDGYGTSDSNNPNVLMIGVEDPDLPGMETAASSEQAPATMGTNRDRDERGEIMCAADCFRGDADQRLVRRTAFAIVAVFERMLRADPTASVIAAGLVTASVGSHQLLQDQNPDGARALVVFRINFRARI